MRLLRLCLVATLLTGTATAAEAGALLDRIRASKVIHCGGVPRPGLVDVEPDGAATGLLLDMCRAIGAAVLGGEGRIDFQPFDSTKSFDAVRDGSRDVVFLTASEMLDAGLADKLLPGPPVFYQTTAVMVPETSPFQHVADLAGHPICFSLGSSTQRHLEAWFAARHADFIRMGYQEDVELYDTYGARVCDALAGESTTLADIRRDGGVNDIRSRLLPEPLAAFPVMAATPLEDPAFAAVVAWTIHTLVRAETPATAWAAGGLDALHLDGAGLGLDKDWQARVIASTGSYGDIFARNLGDRSELHLERGLNAPTAAGGAFVSPYAE